MKNPDPATIRRLALVKSLFLVGIEQSRGPEPLNAFSILTMHDGVELFLQLASEHVDEGKRNILFLEYWDVLKKRLPGDGLTQRESMRRLNEARRSLKHHGTLPSRLDIEGLRASTVNFFEENVPIVFGLEFRNLSLVELVTFERSRKALEEAQREIEMGTFKNAMEHCSLALAYLLADYESQIEQQFGPAVGIARRRDLTKYSLGLDSMADGIRRLIDDVDYSLESLQRSECSKPRDRWQEIHYIQNSHPSDR
jgi:hypothetical protein